MDKDEAIEILENIIYMMQRTKEQIEKGHEITEDFTGNLNNAYEAVSYAAIHEYI